MCDAAVALFAGKLAASRAADVAIAIAAARLPLGIAPGVEHLQRLEIAVETIIGDESLPENDSATDETEDFKNSDSQEMRLERLAESEILKSDRATRHAALKEHGFKEWIRTGDPEACDVCAPLIGRIYSISEGFKDHPGCRCNLEGVGGPAPIEAPEEQPQSRITFQNSIRSL